MLFNEHVNISHLSDGWIILAKEKWALTQILRNFDHLKAINLFCVDRKGFKSFIRDGSKNKSVFIFLFGVHVFSMDFLSNVTVP